MPLGEQGVRLRVGQHLCMDEQIPCHWTGDENVGHNPSLPRPGAVAADGAAASELARPTVGHVSTVLPGSRWLDRALDDHLG